MFLTEELLKEKGACEEGTAWFICNFPDGGEYQDVLNGLAKENRFGWAQWALRKFGTIESILEVSELNCEASVFFAGAILVKGTIKIANWLLSGSGIEAGEGIEAGSGIKAGEDFGIYAGLRIKVSLKKQFAFVTAKEQPKNILCGDFKEIK